MGLKERKELERQGLQRGHLPVGRMSQGESKRPPSPWQCIGGLIFAIFYICIIARNCSDRHPKSHEYATEREITREQSDGPSWWGKMLCVVNDPTDNLRMWYESLYQYEHTRLESLTSGLTRPALRRARDRIRQLLQTESWDRRTHDTVRTLSPRFSLTELRYEIIDKSGDTAWVQVTGELIAATALGETRSHIDDRVRMVKENGEWRFRCFEKRFMSGFEKRLEEEIVGPGFLECR